MASASSHQLHSCFNQLQNLLVKFNKFWAMVFSIPKLQIDRRRNSFHMLDETARGWRRCRIRQRGIALFLIRRCRSIVLHAIDNHICPKPLLLPFLFRKHKNYVPRKSIYVHKIAYGVWVFFF